MADYTLLSDSTNPDDHFGSIVTVSKNGIDHLGDLPDLFLQFLQASGYTYVDAVVIISKDGKEYASL
jgi:hypothetical protein